MVLFLYCSNGGHYSLPLRSPCGPPRAARPPPPAWSPCRPAPTPGLCPVLGRKHLSAHFGCFTVSFDQRGKAGACWSTCLRLRRPPLPASVLPAPRGPWRLVRFLPWVVSECLSPRPLRRTVSVTCICRHPAAPRCRGRALLGPFSSQGTWDPVLHRAGVQEAH